MIVLKNISVLTNLVGLQEEKKKMNTINIKCVCGNIFSTWPCRIKRGRGKFCSRGCKGISVTKKICKCGKQFTLKSSLLKHHKGIYCSSSCAAHYRVRESHLIEKYCQNCKKKFSVIPSRKKTANFCSRQCWFNMWSSKYQECVQCHSQRYKYKKNGLCTFCFNRLPINKIVWQNYNHQRRQHYKSGNVDSQFLKQLWFNTRTCIICKKTLLDNSTYPNGKNLDHIIPFNHNNLNYPKGTHSKNNVRYICADCNNHRPRDGSDILSQLSLQP